MRASGILMHITSLPGPAGIGTLGKPAYAFVDFLARAGQRYWQLLPLNPTGFGDSPYQSCSAFAGNHYLIDPEWLAEEGLLLPEEWKTVDWGENPETVDFGKIYAGRTPLLEKAFSRFREEEKLDTFIGENADWLPDYALYMALKAAHRGAPWYLWEDPLKHRQPEALWNARQTYSRQIRYYCFRQYLFDKQWRSLRQYAHAKGIRIIGDVPIYVPLDSAEVWCSPELFLLDERLMPKAVAGCPPDAFSEDGQLWGNPLYRWEVMKKDGYSWWLRRLRAAARLYDTVRLDHFRGFEAYWSVPYGEATAKNGSWIPGPGMDFFRAVKKHLPELSLIAEDLGYLTPEVLQLREASGLPGMKVLGFAFDSREPSAYLPHTYGKNTVCYTGTHDNMTARQWFETAGEDSVAHAREYMGIEAGQSDVLGMIRTAMGSVSDLCVIPMQDWLELGAEARMNFPGTAGGNWTWRARSEHFSHALADRICKLTVLYGRLENKEN